MHKHDRAILCTRNAFSLSLSFFLSLSLSFSLSLSDLPGASLGSDPTPPPLKFNPITREKRRRNAQMPTLAWSRGNIPTLDLAFTLLRTLGAGLKQSRRPRRGEGSSAWRAAILCTGGPDVILRKHGLSTEQFPVSAYIGSSKNLKDLKAVHQEGIAGTKSEGSTVHRGISLIRNRPPP